MKGAEDESKRWHCRDEKILKKPHWKRTESIDRDDATSCYSMIRIELFTG